MFYNEISAEENSLTPWPLSKRRGGANASVIVPIQRCQWTPPHRGGLGGKKTKIKKTKSKINIMSYNEISSVENYLTPWPLSKWRGGTNASVIVSIQR